MNHQAAPSYARKHCRPLVPADLERAQRESLSELDDRSVGAIALTKDPGGCGTCVLMLKCAASQQWIFPKGHPNPGEDDMAAATRETLEETGVNLTRLHQEAFSDVGYSFIKRLHKDRWQHHEDHPCEEKRPILVTHKVVRYYLAFVNTEDAAQVASDGTEEASACEWVPRSQVEGRLKHAEEKAALETLLAREEAAYLLD